MLVAPRKLQCSQRYLNNSGPKNDHDLFVSSTSGVEITILNVLADHNLEEEAGGTNASSLPVSKQEQNMDLAGWRHL